MKKKFYNEEDLKILFSKIKFKENICIVHSNLIAFCNFKFKIKNFFNLFIDIVGKEKTYVFPASTWVYRKNWFSNNEPSNTGMLSEYVRNNISNIRSLNPIHSVIIIGPKKNMIPTDYSKTSFGKNSTWEWLANNKNVINLSLGINLNGGATFLHVLEEKNKVSYRYKKKINVNIYNNKKKVASQFFYFSRKKNVYNSWKNCEKDLIKNNIFNEIKNKYKIKIFLMNTLKASRFINRKLNKNKQYLIKN